jgi:hypothetical protein
MEIDKIDQKIRDLFNIVQTKKIELEKLRAKPSYNTNCSFQREPTSEKFNLRVLSTQDLVEVFSFLKMREFFTTKAQEELGLTPSKFIHQGHSIDEWKDDFKTLILQNKIKNESKDLEEKEKKLNLLISPDARRQLEIEALEKELT